MASSSPSSLVLRAAPCRNILDRPEFRSRTVDTHLALNNLKALFKAAVLKLDRRRLTCFIDTLDECDEQQALEMIRFFEDLTNTSTKNDIPLRICFSSRPYPHMMIPTSILLTLEDQPDHAADMKSYISNNLRIEDPKLAEELKLRIMQKASGVFMWVVVVIPILNNDDRWGHPTIKRQLEELPDSLSNLFKDILTRDKENPDDLLFSVLWVLYAKWPLTPEEYYHALWCGLKLRGRADAEIPDVSDTFVREKINRYIVTSSKGLVEVTKFRVPTVQFIHETVRDFLLKENGLGYILSHAGPKRNSICHDMLKQCCGVFLSLCSTLDINEGFRGSHPFRRYCSLNILHHANAAAEHIPQRSFLADLDLPILVQGLRLFQKPPRYTEAVSLTYILAREGLSKLIPTWLEICPNIHIYGEEYRHPLFAAVNESRHTTAALLGVAPGSPEYQLVKRMNASDIDDTPLSLACRLGDFGMVRLLLNSGDDPNHTNKQGSSLLWEALKGGHDSISALLIEGGADANRKFHLTNMYLGLASSKGYHATAKCLLERGAVVDSIAWSWQTPLLEASRNGHEDIVSLLVEAGADLTRTDQKGRTPLATASRRGSPDLVRLLIEHGSDVNAKDKQDSTPLALALRAGRWQAAKTLIENGADFNLSDLDGYPLLLRSSREGHGDVVELLIQHGEDASMLPEPPVQEPTRNPLEDYEPSPELPIGPETFDNIFMRFL
uniref:Nephrocystin 3-like N-terminal domain-containing protein n=1 Tax=Bionectria ochroleuca TaxID=29856 RepID=A0A8H7NEL9_BIOOC